MCDRTTNENIDMGREIDGTVPRCTIDEKKHRHDPNKHDGTIDSGACCDEAIRTPPVGGRLDFLRCHR